MTGDLIMCQYAIYQRPVDYPTKFVVRRWDVIEGRAHPKPHPRVATATTLEEARALIPDHCVNIGRAPDDDPVIAEVWV